MGIVKQRVWVIFSAVWIVLFLGLYQSCGNFKNQNNESQDIPVKQTDGGGDISTINGVPYEGKVFSSVEKCSDNSPVGKIKYSAVKNSLILREACQDLNPFVEVQSQVELMVKGSAVVLMYEGREFQEFPAGNPVVITDFVDVIGGNLSTLYVASATVQTDGSDATLSSMTAGVQVSLDQINWSAELTVFGQVTVYARMNSPSNADQIATALFALGTSNLDWIISTESPLTLFDTPGTFNWRPKLYGSRFQVECWGGGGGGGGGGGAGTFGGGGGGGGYSQQVFLRQEVGSDQIITVGTGGAAATASFVSGGNGEASSFGSLMAAGGGNGGLSSNLGGTGGAGGVGISAAGGNGSNNTGGIGGGTNGGTGGSNSAAGQAPGGGGGGSSGAGGGGNNGNGAGPAGMGGSGRCIVTTLP